MAQFSFVASRPDLNTRSKHRLRAILQNYAIKFAAQRDSDKLFRFEVAPCFANAVLRDSNSRCCQFTVVFLNYRYFRPIQIFYNRYNGVYTVSVIDFGGP